MSNHASVRSAEPVAYCMSPDVLGVRAAPAGHHWVEAISGRVALFAANATSTGANVASRCYLAPDGMPQVLVLRSSDAGRATTRPLVASLAAVSCVGVLLTLGVLCVKLRATCGGARLQQQVTVANLARLRNWGAASTAPVLIAREMVRSLDPEVSSGSASPTSLPES